MFFSLSHIEDERFTHHFYLGDFILNTDNGWYQRGNRVCKGYTDDFFIIPDEVEDQQLGGNFCVFEYSDNQIKLKTNKLRSFPVWANDSEVTNLNKLTTQYWTDDSIVINEDLSIISTKLNFLDFDSVEELSGEEVVNRVDNILKKKIYNFLKIAREHEVIPKVFCSGGVDSTLVMSYVNSSTTSYEMVLENTVEWDYFWCKNSGTIKKNFWAYNQIHHWKEYSLLTSGTPGDEFMLRSPSTGHLWLMYNGIDIFDLLKGKDYLHTKYFFKHIDLFERQKENGGDVMRLSRENFLKHLVNNLINDCQHWHLGNTLTYTPLRDIEILKLFLRLNVQDGIKQFMNSDISRELIRKNYPNGLNLMSTDKNSGNILENLITLL
jgi:hypothetical protein